MYSFSLENPPLPFELTGEESTLLSVLKLTLSIAAQSPSTNLKKTEIDSVKNFPPEQIIKFLLIDPSLLRATEHEELKKYWRDYIETYQYEYNILSFNFTIQKKPQISPIAHKSYPVQIREDLSFAQQGMALYCLIQDKNFAEIRTEEVRHQWRMLAVKYGSLQASMRALRVFQRTLRPTRDLFNPTPQDLKIMKEALDFAQETARIHGTAGFYILAYLAMWLWGETGLPKQYSPLLSCTYRAFLLAEHIKDFPYCQTSMNDITFGNPTKFYEICLNQSDANKLIETTQEELGQTETTKIATEIEINCSSFPTLFAQKSMGAKDLFDDCKEVLKVPAPPYNIK